jgi:hypothetical protein
MHSSVGIALGRSNHTNGMIFWDPITQRMNVSADYRLDHDSAIGAHFPSVVYDGQISPLVLRGGKNKSNKEPFPPNSEVQVELDGEYFNGTVVSVPIDDTLSKYHISFPDSPEIVEVTPDQLAALDEPVYPMSSSMEDNEVEPLLPTLPEWMQDDTHVTLNVDGRRLRGVLTSGDLGWMFVQRTASESHTLLI